MSPKRRVREFVQSVVLWETREVDPTLDYLGAYEFYKDHIIGRIRAKLEIYHRYGFKNPTGGTDDWEVFGAILVRDKATGGYGTDLEKHEVKSAKRGGSFEYQYHKDHGLEKLADDEKVRHLFICYSNDFADIDVWRVDGNQLAEIFEGWREGYIKNYKSEKQRYRKSIAFGTVRTRGKLIMQIAEGDIVFPKITGESRKAIPPSDS